MKLFATIDQRGEGKVNFPSSAWVVRAKTDTTVYWVIQSPFTFTGTYYDTETFEPKHGKLRNVYVIGKGFRKQKIPMPINMENDEVVEIAN